MVKGSCEGFVKVKSLKFSDKSLTLVDSKLLKHTCEALSGVKVFLTDQECLENASSIVSTRLLKQETACC